MVRSNPSWGEERIASELLLKIGIQTSPRTVRRYMPNEPRRKQSTQSWMTFVRNHAKSIIACDFFVVVTATFRLVTTGESSNFRPVHSSLVNCGRFSYFNIMLDRIKIDPKVCEGKATIRGMRITVDFVLKLLGDGYSADDIVSEYPELQKEDVYQAAKYGAWLASEKTSVIA
jgi:uncharacterized protein (DUF433 family)